MPTSSLLDLIQAKFDSIEVSLARLNAIDIELQKAKSIIETQDAKIISLEEKLQKFEDSDPKSDIELLKHYIEKLENEVESINGRISHI